MKAYIYHKECEFSLASDGETKCTLYLSDVPVKWYHRHIPLLFNPKHLIGIVSGTREDFAKYDASAQLTVCRIVDNEFAIIDEEISEVQA